MGMEIVLKEVKLNDELDPSAVAGITVRSRGLITQLRLARIRELQTLADFCQNEMDKEMLEIGKLAKPKQPAKKVKAGTAKIQN